MERPDRHSSDGVAFYFDGPERLYAVSVACASAISVRAKSVASLPAAGRACPLDAYTTGALDRAPYDTDLTPVGMRTAGFPRTARCG